VLLLDTRDDQTLVSGVPRQPCPARTLDRGGLCGELALESSEAREIASDLIGESTTGLAATVGAHVAPEHGVVQVAAEVERVLARPVPYERGVVVRTSLLELLERGVRLVHVGLVVLGVMDLHRLRIDVGFERGVVVREVRERVLVAHVAPFNGSVLM
jgi:hypothetical protein